MNIRFAGRWTFRGEQTKAGRNLRVRGPWIVCSEKLFGTVPRLWHWAPAAMRWLSIRSSRPSPLPCDSRTNKRAGVFCFAKCLVKRASRRNRRSQEERRLIGGIDFIIFRGRKILWPSERIKIARNGSRRDKTKESLWVISYFIVWHL